MVGESLSILSGPNAVTVLVTMLEYTEPAPITQVWKASGLTSFDSFKNRVFTLKDNGLIDIDLSGRKISVSLTPVGKAVATELKAAYEILEKARVSEKIQ